MTTKEVSELLGTYVSKRKGQFKFWKSYFWGITSNADKLVDLVKTKIPNVKITGHGNHYHSFVGGAKSGSDKDSYLWVTFTIPEKSIEVEHRNFDPHEAIGQSNESFAKS